MVPDAEFKRWDWKSKKWVMVPTVTAGAARAFLEENRNRATIQSAKLNRSMTREEAWNMLMNDIKGLKDEQPVHYRVYRNILREFGGRRR